MHTWLHIYIQKHRIDTAIIQTVELGIILRKSDLEEEIQIKHNISCPGH